MKILLSPHADDETLFACYTLLRERPLVVLCLAGAERHGSPAIRSREFAAAMEVLDCPWINLIDTELEPALNRISPEYVWAPLPEHDGNDDHNLIGELAANLWPEKVSFYTTYTSASRTTVGTAVPFEPSWPQVKREALACYKSQQRIPGMREHFNRPLDEYLVERTELAVGRAA